MTVSYLLQAGDALSKLGYLGDERGGGGRGDILAGLVRELLDTDHARHGGGVATAAGCPLSLHHRSRHAHTHSVSVDIRTDALAATRRRR